MRTGVWQNDVVRTDQIILLPGENAEELERMQFHWEREWEPEGYMEERLVEILVYNDWTLAQDDGCKRQKPVERGRTWSA